MTENQKNSNNDLMGHPPHSESNKSSTSEKNTHDNKSPDYEDIILHGKGTKVVDLETLVKETQKRVWAALKQGYEYESTIIDESERFLRDLVSSRINMIVLYVDLVGSTEITLSLPEEKE